MEDDAKIGGNTPPIVQSPPRAAKRFWKRYRSHYRPPSHGKPAGAAGPAAAEKQNKMLANAERAWDRHAGDRHGAVRHNR